MPVVYEKEIIFQRDGIPKLWHEFADAITTLGVIGEDGNVAHQLTLFTQGYIIRQMLTGEYHVKFILEAKRDRLLAIEIQMNPILLQKIPQLAVEILAQHNTDTTHLDLPV